jgi:hypothetical protein
MQEQDFSKALKLSELTVKKQYYKILADQARKAVARAEEVIALRNAQVVAAIDELEYLRRALSDLALEEANIASTACGGSSAMLCKSAAVVLQATAGKTFGSSEIALTRSISHYLDSVTIGRIGYEVADVRIKNMSYQRALDDSQFALVAYDALITSPVTLLANYHAAGWTASEIAQLAQVLGVAGIAVK